MNKIIDYVLDVVLFTMIIGGAIFLHETVHYTIAQEYDCEDIEMKVGWEGVSVNAHCTQNIEDIRRMNIINDIIGYSITPFLVLFAWRYVIK